MAKVIFRSKLADFRVLTKANIASAGVELEFNKTSFPRNTAVSVSDEVAKVLIDNPDTFGKFDLVENTTELDIPAEAPAAKKAPAGK